MCAHLRGEKRPSETRGRKSKRYSHIKFMWQRRAPKEISLWDYRQPLEQTTGRQRAAFSCRSRLYRLTWKEEKTSLLLFVYYQRAVISFSFNFMLFFLCLAARSWQPVTTHRLQVDYGIAGAEGCVMGRLDGRASVGRRQL